MGPLEGELRAACRVPAAFSAFGPGKGLGWVQEPTPQFPVPRLSLGVVGPWALEMVAEHVRMGLGWVLKCVKETSVNTLVQ